MGDMGQQGKPRSKKRAIRKRRRRSKGGAVLAWLPDSSLPKHPGAKHAFNSWMSHSFKVSNPEAMIESLIPQELVSEFEQHLSDCIETVQDSNANVKVEITRPEKDYPHWTSEMEMVSNGTLRKTSIESVTLRDVFERSVVWIQYQAKS